MAFSPFDKRLLEEGLTFFSRPRMASLLEALGTSEGERVDTLATMLRHAAPDEFDEAVAVFERALARVTKEQERDRTPDDEPRRRRYSAAAERREQRRRSA
jgi:exoribonuclease R